MTHENEYLVDAVLQITAESPEEAAALLGGLGSFTAGLIVPVMARVHRKTPKAPEDQAPEPEDQAQAAPQASRAIFDGIMGGAGL